MKFSFLIIILLTSSLLCDAQESNTEKQKIKLYLNLGSTAAYIDINGVQAGFTIGKNNQVIKFQYMYKQCVLLENYEDPNIIEELKTYSLTYGRSFDSQNKNVSYIPYIGIIGVEEYFRGDIIKTYSSGGLFFSRTEYEYDYSLSKYFGARIGLEILVKFSKYIGFSVEPHLNLYHRTDVGISFNFILGKFN